MKSFTLCFLFLIRASSFAADPFSPVERTVSTSRQFLVFGTTTQLRGAIAETAEQVKTNTLSILRQRDHWKTPIVINLQFPQANIPDVPDAALYFSQTGAGLKLQVDLVIGQDMEAKRIQREVLRAILLERMYRTEPNLAAGSVYVQPPDWLLDGLLAAAAGQDRKPLADALSSLSSETSIPSLESFLRQRPGSLDSSSRQLYRAYSLGLVQLFLDQENGATRLSGYIDNLRKSPNDQFTALQSEFQTSKPGELEIKWRASLRGLGTLVKFELLTFAETERRLDEIVKMKVGKGENAAGIENLITQKLSRAQKTALILIGENLTLLQATANPLMRPIVGEYQQIVQLAAIGNRSGLTKRLARVKSTRTRLVARMQDVEDYLNWFEATQMKTRSDLFSEYLRGASDREAPARRRRDAISVYLDSLEQQVGN